MKFLKFDCPACDGEGGETEIITDDGRGPYYECGFCKGEGEVGLWKKFQWDIMIVKFPILDGVWTTLSRWFQKRNAVR